MNTAGPRQVAVIGGGWAGLSAAVAATRGGAQVTLFEASRSLGGRARSVPVQSTDRESVNGDGLDNGQHILIGAYSSTLALLRELGVAESDVLLRTPLALRTCDGNGLSLPNLPSPLDLGWGLASARGWSIDDKLALIRRALRWQRAGFECADSTSVADLTRDLPRTIRDTFIDPICVSALNTPAQSASGSVFLRVLKDALFGPRGSSNLLLPKVGLGMILPEPAHRWLANHGASVRLGRRVQALSGSLDGGVDVDGMAFDHLVIAVAAPQAVQLLASVKDPRHTAQRTAIDAWIEQASGIQFNAIATCYARTRSIDHPNMAGRMQGVMTALRPSPEEPAQFVFDRSRLGAEPGSLAFVVSASKGDVASLEAAVVKQAQRQLGLSITPQFTIIEKRATFSCTPALARPPMAVLPGISVAGDYCEGPYPATLEGAVRAGLAAGERAARAR